MRRELGLLSLLLYVRTHARREYVVVMDRSIGPGRGRPNIYLYLSAAGGDPTISVGPVGPTGHLSRYTRVASG